MSNESIVKFKKIKGTPVEPWLGAGDVNDLSDGVLCRSNVTLTHVARGNVPLFSLILIKNQTKKRSSLEAILTFY